VSKIKLIKQCCKCPNKDTKKKKVQKSTTFKMNLKNKIFKKCFFMLVAVNIDLLIIMKKFEDEALLPFLKHVV
jgi:hypothetical protein